MDNNERMEIIKERLSKIKHKVVVMSGKGGVGKTTVAVNLAIKLASTVASFAVKIASSPESRSGVLIAFAIVAPVGVKAPVRPILKNILVNWFPS